MKSAEPISPEAVSKAHAKLESLFAGVELRGLRG